MKNVAIAATGVSAHAEGWYAGVGLGQAQVSFESVDVSPATLSEDDTSSSYKLFGGYEFSKYFAVEGGYQHLDDFSQTITLGGSSATGKIDGYGIFLDAVGKYPVTNNFTVFGKLGVARTRIELKTSASGIFAGCCSDESETEFNPRYGIGAQYDFNKQMGVRFELERTDNVGKSDATGEEDIDYLGLSLTYKF